MNPNTQQQNLDPKLKEAYDRVMGSQINPTPSAPAMPVQPQPPASHEIPSTPAKLDRAMASAQASTPIININQTQTGAKPQQVQKVKGKGLSPVIFIVLGLLFFGGYTIIWLKVFKIF